MRWERKTKMCMMKYGIAQWCFPNGQYAFALAEKAGYDGVQVETGLDSNGYYMRDKGMQRIYLEAAKRHRQEIISVVDNDLMYVGCQGKKDEEEYKKSICAIEMTVDTAVELGCKRIMLPMFFRSQIHMDQPETFERAVEVLRHSCEYAGNAGIEVQVETSISARNQIELMAAVNMPNLVNFYDFQNLYWYDGLDAVKELPALMPVNGLEMHVCDGWGQMTKDGNGGRLLGTGEARTAEQVKIICDYGWKGWLIVENAYYLPTMRGEGSYVELAKRDLATLKSLVGKCIAE